MRLRPRASLNGYALTLTRTLPSRSSGRGAHCALFRARSATVVDALVGVRTCRERVYYVTVDTHQGMGEHSPWNEYKVTNLRWGYDEEGHPSVSL